MTDKKAPGLGSIFLSAILAGVCIALGGGAFLSLESKIAGAIAFTIGLFVICSYGFHLFTGKICYVLDNDGRFAAMLPVIWVGNIIGTWCVAFLERQTRVGAAMAERAAGMVDVKLGDSLLTQVNGYNGGKAPDINDPDYFIDCYEVVRELVEDEVVMAGVNVADGGLITAAQRMCGDLGIDMDINGILSSYQNDGRSRILFGEVPLLKYYLNSLFCQYLQRETSLYSIISGLRLFLYCIRILYLNDVALFRSFYFLIWRHC
jgi:hypothetical protein